MLPKSENLSRNSSEIAEILPAASDGRPALMGFTMRIRRETVQADDLWIRLLASCPPEHRPLLYLRREGHSLAEIAARTGLHRDSVRRILRTLAGHVAFAQSGSTHAARGAPS